MAGRPLAPPPLSFSSLPYLSSAARSAAPAPGAGGSRAQRPWDAPAPQVPAAAALGVAGAARGSRPPAAAERATSPAPGAAARPPYAAVVLATAQGAAAGARADAGEGAGAGAAGTAAAAAQGAAQAAVDLRDTLTSARAASRPLLAPPPTLGATGAGDALSSTAIGAGEAVIGTGGARAGSAPAPAPAMQLFDAHCHLQGAPLF